MPVGQSQAAPSLLSRRSIFDGHLAVYHRAMSAVRRSGALPALALLMCSSCLAAAQAEDPPDGEARLAVIVLESLPVKGRAPKTGYSREAFGPRWADTDYNGCDTRNDMLRRDLVNIVLKPRTRGCVVLEGLLVDPYSGEEIPFIRGEGTFDDVQIDHVVSLSNAWQTGMFQRGPEERRIFANDTLNLLAVWGRLNEQKGDGDAATWLPPRKAYRCEFVARQIAVKAAYSLWLTPPEKQAMLRILRGCPEQTLPAR